MQIPIPPGLDPNSEAAKILADPELSRRRKLLILRGEKSKRLKELEGIATEQEMAQLQVDAFTEIQEWAESPVKYSSIKTSKLHELASSPVLVLTDETPALVGVNLDGCQTFLMQHNWARLIEGTEADEGEVRLPHELTAFELELSRRRVIVLGKEFPLRVYVQTRRCWVNMGDTEEFKNHGKQCRALCILLESQALDAEVVRAPHKLNAQRERRGKLPIYDHHILKLANRKRYGALEPSGNERSSPRLHFRRGHWRHYQDHKTWIAWQLVGDPDLGFVDKDYAY